MPFLQKRPSGRRRANLQINYSFDRGAYVRFRLRCWGGACLDRGRLLLRRMAGATLAMAGAARRRARKGPSVAASRGRAHAWLGARPDVLTSEELPSGVG